MSKIELLQKSGLTIFNTDDLMVLWSASNRREVTESIKDYVRRGRVFRIRRGIYSLSKTYDINELAQKLTSPSYISYYTALGIHGINFQKYSDIHCFGEYSKTLTVNDQRFVYHKIDSQILQNQEGIIQPSNYSIASQERAICDSLYINKYIAFDNLKNIDIQKLESISKIYKNNRLEKDIYKLIKEIQTQNVE